jgi:restriction endonuclease S subunit
MIISEIRYNQAIERLRFDAEFYLPEYLELENKLAQIGYTSLNDLLEDINRNPMAYGFTYIKEGYPLIRGVDIKPPFIELNAIKRISKREQQKYKSTAVYTGDLIMTVRGTIGQVAVVTDDIGEANISPNLIYLRPKNKKISEFLAVVLNSKIGQCQIQQIITGSVQGTITEPQICAIRIPKFSKEVINEILDFVKQAYKKRKLADERYKKAEALLNKLLGIEKLELKQEKVFEARFNEIEETLRFDAEHYQPKYGLVKEFITKSEYKVKKLREVVEISDKKIEPSSQPTELFSYIELANINPSTGEIEEVSQIKGYEAPSRARMLLEKGDVLVSSLLGSLDNVGLVPEEFDDAVASTGFFVIRSKTFLPEFLFLLFKSNLMRLQLEEKTAGAIMSAVPKTTFGDLLIPLIPQETQKQISDLIKQSFELRKESKQLIEQAKKEVEKFIENQNR